nr:phage virion morphogenesis protein [Trichlorobacter sp.]
MVTINHNLPDAQKRLEALARKAGTIQPALKTIGLALEANIRERWDKEIDPAGNKWQALKASTLKRKAKKKKPLKILLQDDQLRFNINSQVEGSNLIIGSPQKYAAVHQLGGPAGRKGRQFTMTARPFLGISKQDEADILDEIEQHLKF